MKKIDAYIESKNISLRGIAKDIDVDYSVIRNGVKGSTSEMKLETFLLFVNKVYIDKERRDIVNEFIKKCKAPLNIRKCLAYCQCAGEYYLMDHILEKQELKILRQKEVKKKNKGNKEKHELELHLDIYKLYNQRNNNLLKGQELLEDLYNLPLPKDEECLVLLDTLYMAAMYDIPNIHAMQPYADKIMSNLDNIENAFIKSCLEMICYERIAYVQLLRNDLDLCRVTCGKILSSKLDLPIIKATAYFCMGESFSQGKQSDICIAENYMELAVKILEDVNTPRKTQKYKAFKTTLAHLFIENNFNLHKIDFSNIDITEEAYYECEFGDYDKGMKLYKQIQEEGKWSPFVEYSFSKVTNDSEGLKRALLSFESCGHTYYANLVKRSLLREGVL